MSRLRFIHDRRFCKFVAFRIAAVHSSFIMTASSWLVVTITQIGHVHCPRIVKLD